MERDLELRIKGHLYEIGTVNDEVKDGRQGFPQAEEGYRETLKSVAEVAGRDLIDEVAAHIKDSLKKNGDRPRNQAVRKKARLIVSRAGHSPDDYLNTA